MRRAFVQAAAIWLLAASLASAQWHAASVESPGRASGVAAAPARLGQPGAAPAALTLSGLPLGGTLLVAPAAPAVTDLVVPALPAAAEAVCLLPEGREAVLDAPRIASYLGDMGMDAEMAGELSRLEAAPAEARARPSGRVERLARQILEHLRKDRPEDLLPDPERRALKLYAWSFSRRTNEVLGARNAGPESAPRPYLGLAALATSGLNRLPDYRGRVSREVYVKEAEAAAFAERYQEGAVVAEKGFVSASRPGGEPYGAMRGGWKDERFLFRIESKTGKSIERISGVPGEREVLFRPGTRFRVTKHVTRTRGGYTEHRIRLVEVDDGPAPTTGPPSPAASRLNVDTVLDNLNPFTFVLNRILGVSHKRLAPASLFRPKAPETIVGINGVSGIEPYAIPADYMTGAAVPGVQAFRASSPERLVQTLLSVYREHGPIAKLVIAAHGRPGSLSIGGWEMDRDWAESKAELLESLPYDLFLPGAQVRLISCSAAGGSLLDPGEGAAALKRIFAPLLKQGGTILAATRYVDPQLSLIPAEFKTAADRIIRHLASPLLLLRATLKWLAADWRSKVKKVVAIEIPAQPLRRP